MNIENLELEYKILSEYQAKMSLSLIGYGEFSKAIEICYKLFKHIEAIQHKLDHAPPLKKELKELESIAHSLDYVIDDIRMKQRDGK